MNLTNVTDWITSSETENSNPAGKDSLFEFLTEGLLLTIISTFGFLGNALSIYVLLKPSVRGIFSSVLTGLASFDALFLMGAIITFGMPHLSLVYKEVLFPPILPICYGLVHIFRVGSVFATLSVTLERFFAIVFPFKDVDLFIKWLIPGTVVFTVSYNIPKFFEITTIIDPNTNLTAIVGTEMRQNPLYISLYLVWSKIILTELVPYFTILILNSFIVVKIVQSSRFRSKVVGNVNSANSCGGANLSAEEVRYLEKQRQEHKLGILLVAISVLFITCQSFKIIPDLYEVIFCNKNDGNDTSCSTTPFISTCVNLSHLLVCFNSSANVVIYLLGGEKFRRAWCQTYLKSSRCCMQPTQMPEESQQFGVSQVTTLQRQNRCQESLERCKTSRRFNSTNGRNGHHISLIEKSTSSKDNLVSLKKACNL